MQLLGTYNTLEAFQEGLAEKFPGENVEVWYTTTWDEDRPHPQMQTEQGVWVMCTERMKWNMQQMNHQYFHRQDVNADWPKIWVLHADGFPLQVINLDEKKR